jgi:HK97 family phage major capsid protein
MNPRELRQRADELAREARALVDGKAELTAEEQRKFDELMEQARAKVADAERIEGLDTLQRNLEQPVGSAHRPDPRVGMTDKEVRQYSLIRAINAQLRGDWRGAELEADASRAVAQKLGKEPQGFFLPYDVQTRDMTVGTTTAGGYLKETQLASGSFIEMLRNRMVLNAAGAQMLTGLVGDVAIPKQSAGATAYWVAESGAPTESQQTLAQVALAPKTVGAWTDISRKLLKQASIDVEGFVQRDIATVVGLAIDLAGLHGTGSNNQPTGVAATSGIGSVAGGDNGLAPTWAHVVQLETEVAQDNADVGAMAYVTNAKVRGKLKTTQVTATYGDRMIWADGPTPLNGYRSLVSNQVSSALTKGSSSGVCSAIFFGNWADLIIGMWGGLDVLVDPYTGGTSGTVRVIALQDVDVAIRHAESFAAMLDALTS